MHSNSWMASGSVHEFVTQQTGRLDDNTRLRESDPKIPRYEFNCRSCGKRRSSIARLLCAKGSAWMNQIPETLCKSRLRRGVWRNELESLGAFNEFVQPPIQWIARTGLFEVAGVDCRSNGVINLEWVLPDGPKQKCFYQGTGEHGRGFPFAVDECRSHRLQIRQEYCSKISVFNELQLVTVQRGFLIRTSYERLANNLYLIWRALAIRRQRSRTRHRVGAGLSVLSPFDRKTNRLHTTDKAGVRMRAARKQGVRQFIYQPEDGIPLTRSGRRRKAGAALGCAVFLVIPAAGLLFALLKLLFAAH